ncbi:dimethylarginine dimethylaminohydrolase family protein [Nocardioides terrisoli]|uniref:dimethylarginine dimethylaminohydrolase family protein n=1 Tax=Nocardioides terrisoli TaxID=3388267 RepID=UPI00287B5DC5|nr:arginine deiminase-related protein [Nocardioides marmorisolisilvae]
MSDLTPRDSSLAWGRRYLMVPPAHFRVDYAINPFMHLEDQPEPGRTWRQFEAIRDAIESAGGTVETLDQRADAPDMVYAMNLGLFLDSDSGPGVVLSHMRYDERRMETVEVESWAQRHGRARWRTGRDGVGAHFEAGDAFPWRGDLLVGFGPRTEELALKHLATDLGVTVRGFRITHPGMYHMDLSFLPLDDQHAMVCPAAYDDASAAALLDRVPEPLVLTEDEAMTFCANAVVVGRTVVMPACPARVRTQLEEWGFEIVVVDTGEYLKGGGSVRCLTNPLDIRLGRDLVTADAGRVLLP